MIQTIIEICSYLVLSLGLFIIMSVIATLNIKRFAKKQDWSLTKYIKRELIDDKNTSLAIYIGSKLFAIWVIISHSMALWIIAMSIYSLIWIIIQFAIMGILSKMIGVKDLVKYISEEQNVQVATLYAFTIISISYVIGSVAL